MGSLRIRRESMKSKGRIITLKPNGAVSIFLCIVMSVIIAFVGIMVDASRIRLGKNMVHTAVDDSIDAVLAGYEKNLKELYGIFTIANANEDMLMQRYEKYLSNTLLTQLGIDETSVGKDAYASLMHTLTKGTAYNQMPFLNFYDFEIEHLEVEPVESVVETKIFKDQILDHMKYRAPRVWITGFLENINALRGVQKQTDIIKDKMNFDKKADAIRKKLLQLSDKVKSLNEKLIIIKNSNAEIKTIIENAPKRINHEKYAIPLNKKKEKAYDAYKDSGVRNEDGSMEYDEKKKKAYLKIKEEFDKNVEIIKKTRTLENDAKRNLSNASKAYVKQYEAVKKLYENVQDNIQGIINEKNSILSRLGKEPSDFSNAVQRDLSQFDIEQSTGDLEALKNDMSKNHETVLAYGAQINENLTLLEKDIDENYEPQDADKVTNLLAKPPKITAKVILKTKTVEFYQKNYLEKLKTHAFERKDIQKSDKKPENTLKTIRNEEKKLDEINYEKKVNKDLESQAIENLSAAKAQTSEATNESVQSLEQEYGEDLDVTAFYKKVQKDLTKAYQNSKNFLPSQMDVKKRKSTQVKEYTNTYEVDNSKEQEALTDASALFAGITNSLEGIYENLMINEYALAVFQDALSWDGVSWDQDFQGINKSHRATLFKRGEVEYLIGGSSTMQTNITLVKAQILLMRLALNTLYVYTSPELYQQSLAIATASVGWFTAGVGIPVMQNVLMMTLAFSESVLDTNMIMNGHKVVLYKTKDTFKFSFTGLTATAMDQVGKMAEVGSHAGIDFMTDKASDIQEKAYKQAKIQLNTWVDNTIHQVFEPIDRLRVQMDAVLRGELKDDVVTMDTKNAYFELPEDEIWGELLNEIHSVAENEVKNIYEAKKNQIMDALENKTYEQLKTVDAEIESIKQKVKAQFQRQIQDVLNKTNQEISEMMKKTADKGKEAVSSNINEVFKKWNGKSIAKNGGVKNNVAGKLLAMDYQDYLRILLLAVPENSKLQRMQDLIVLNMRQKGLKNFKLEDFYTRLNVHAQISTKYLFLTKNFVPKALKMAKSNRHLFTIEENGSY